MRVANAVVIWGILSIENTERVIASVYYYSTIFHAKPTAHLPQILVVVHRHASPKTPRITHDRTHHVPLI